jgi:PAS domain S-box-containing protein
LDFLKNLFSTDFMPHVYCLRDPGLVKLHYLSDGIIAASYFLIPVALFLLIRRRRDLVFPWMFALFGVFILGCGFTHVLAIVTLWHPVYVLDGVVKALTALASIGTAIMLFRLLPAAMNLPNSQQHLAAIVESSEDAVISEDLRGNVTSWNKGAQKMFGYAADEVLGKSIELVAAPVKTGEIAEIVRRIKTGDGVYQLETKRCRKDGREISVSLTASPMRDTKGKIVGISKIVRDITDRKQAEKTLVQVNEELRNSEERFRTLADFVPDMLWTTDATGKATYVSRRYQAYAGRRLQEFLDYGWSKIIHPHDQERVDQVWSESVQTGKPYEIEYRLKRADGVYRWYVARGVPIREANGEIIQWLGSSTDIEELKRTERALRRSNEELEQFAYAAAHDLQEPLRNVANSVGMLSRLFRDSLDERAAEWIDASIKGAQRMQAMVKDLLTYSRIVNDGQPPSVSEANAEEAARTALQNLHSVLTDSQALVQSGQLPSVPVQETHLVQLFQNLIGNALKYRQPDVPPVIRVSAVSTGGEWQFAVADNGIGFDPAYADRIFKVFKRLHNRDEYPGNGIGLAVCARIVAHYGGRIWAEGKPGEGATFRFTLPAHQA